MQLLGAMITEGSDLVLKKATLDPGASTSSLALKVLRLTLMVDLALGTVRAQVIEVLCYRADCVHVIHNLGLVIQTVIVCLG